MGDNEVGSRYPKPGDKVRIVEKKNYGSGELTEGVVKEVLTRQQVHPRGHKVRLNSGIIGRVQEFVGAEEQVPEEEGPVKQAPYKLSEDDLV